MPAYSQSDRLTPPQWVVACSVFGAMVLASLAIGFSAGRPNSGPKTRPPVVAELPKAKSPPVADPTPPPKKVEPKLVAKRPEPEPMPEPEKKTDPEPEMKKPEPKPEPKKVEPPKKTEPKKVEPKKAEPPKTDMALTYTTHIKKIVQQKCIVCHGDPAKKGGLDMKTLALMIKGGKGGPGVVPGKPDDSVVWTSINDGVMPPSDKEQLTDAEKKMIHDWIMAGAK